MSFAKVVAMSLVCKVKPKLLPAKHYKNKPFNIVRNHLSLIAAVSLGLTTVATHATTHYFDNINLTTPGNLSGGNSDGTGVWFDPLTGYSEVRGTTFPTPLFEDGKYFLVMDEQFTQTEAEIFTEGFFSRGNGVIYTSSSNLNPAYFGDNATIGFPSGYQSPGAGFTDLGPTFGNWTAGEHGFLGLTIRNPAGATSSDIFYGYAEILVNSDYSVTLLSMAYNDVQGASITTVSTVPEPSVMALSAVAIGAGVLYRRRRDQA